MKRLHWLLGALLLLALCGPTWAQSGRVGAAQSGEATRLLNSFYAQARSDQLRRTTVDRDTTIGGSRFGPSIIRAPTSVGLSSARSGPPTSRSATFGAGAGRPTSKPFSNLTRTPTVSPYLNLFREGFGGNSDLNYQTIVKPQIQQQAFNRQVNRQAQQLNQQLMSMTARNAYNTQGSETLSPTGHAATFQYYSRFYPAKSRRRQ